MAEVKGGRSKQTWVEMSGIQSGYKEIIFHLEDTEAGAQAAREVIFSPSTEA